MLKRTEAIFIVLCLCFSVVTYKIISLNYSSYSETGKTSSSKTVTVGETRGNIYGRNMEKLVNETEKLVAVAKPGADSLSQAENIFDAEERDEIIKSLTRGFPVTFISENEFDSDDIKTFPVPVRNSDGSYLCHILGYCDGEGNGVTGVEKSFDSFLKQESGSLSVTFGTDGVSRVLSGITPVINDKNYNSKAGVVLTIDGEMQKIAEKAMDENNIKSGACVVLDASDGGIASCVSRPAFDINNVGKTHNDGNSPFVNKAFMPYAVGSVFKPVIAAMAIDNGINTDIGHMCTGSITVGDTQYGCNRKTAHGQTGLSEALQVSCNTYFVDLTRNIGAGLICDFCDNLGFGRGALLSDGMYSADGMFPEKERVENPGEKANLSFGQGGLLATPLQMAGAYLALTDGGFYKYPYLVKGTVDGDGVYTPYERKPDSKVIKESTSEKIRELLLGVVESGNAYNAQSSMCSVGGKTGTAQSGSYDENGREILRTWFVGFFPVNEPLYTVAIMCEDGTGGGTDCAPVFSDIADGIMNLLIERAN